MPAKKTSRASNIPEVVTDSERHARRVEILAVACVLILAIALRVVYLFQYAASVPYFSIPLVDSHYYDSLARRIADGQGYGAAPFYTGPLYPYALALVYKAVGHAPKIIYVLQSLLGVLNLFFVYLLGRRLYGMKHGLVAMIMLALYAPLMYLESKILTETLAISLNLASILLLMGAIDRPNTGRYVLAGLVMGLGVLCRPVGLITIVLILGWLCVSAVRSGRTNAGVGHIAALTAGILLVILPVTARNLIVGGDFALISTNGGVNFAQGNNPRSQGVFTALPGFSGSMHTQQQEEMALASKALGRQVKASESSNYWLKQGLKFVVEQPAQFAWLTVRKAVWSLHNREAACNYNVYLEKMLVPTLRLLFMPFLLLAGLGIFGFARGRAKHVIPEADLLALYALSVFISLIVFSVSSRFRAPLAPALAVFAGFGLVQAVDSVRARSTATIALLVAAVGLVMLVSVVPYPVPPITAEAPANIGTSYLADGRLDEAVAQFRAALRINPRHAYSLGSLGLALARQGKLAEASEEYEKALSIDRNNAEIRSNYGVALREQDRLDEAIAQFREALSTDARSAAAHFELGNTLIRQGKPGEAISEYEAALEIRPEDPDIHFNLGVAHDEQRRTDKAIAAYQQAVKLKPGMAEAHNNLAVALYDAGRHAEAWREVAECRRLGHEPNPGFIEALSKRMPKPPDAVSSP